MTYREEEHRIAVYDDQGREAGEVTYSNAGESMIIIDHTYVSDKFRGQGIAGELVRRMVEKARLENKKIVPLCPFAKAEFLRKPEYRDVEAGPKQ